MNEKLKKNITILVPDTHLTINSQPITSFLSHPNIRIVPRFSEDEDIQVIVIPFYGRNRIDPNTKRYLDSIPTDLPVIGIECDSSDKRNWLTTTLHLQFSAITPAQIICHSILQTVKHFQTRKRLINLRLEYEDRIRETESLVEMGIEFTATLSRRELYSRIIKKSMTLVPSEFHLLRTIDDDGKIAYLASYLTTSNKQQFLPTKRLDAKTYSNLKKLKKPIYDRYPFQEESLIINEVKKVDPSVSSMMIAPILTKNLLLGYLQLGNRSGLRGFTEKDAEHIEVLTDFAAVALENAELYEKTETLAQIDDLTQVQNFKFAYQYLQKLIEKKDNFSLLFLDLDGFKKVNQQYGHLKGNEVLRHVSTILRDHVGSHGLTCRFGGDEFIIIIPGTNVERSTQNAKEFLTLLHEDTMFPEIELSGSIGISFYPADGRTIQDIIQAADAAMYHAKSLGSGNVIEFHSLQNKNGDPIDKTTK